MLEMVSSREGGFHVEEALLVAFVALLVPRKRCSALAVRCEAGSCRGKKLMSLAYSLQSLRMTASPSAMLRRGDGRRSA